MIKQQLNIVQHGLVYGGNISYLADTKTGLIQAQGSVEVGPFRPITKLYPLNLSVKVEPSFMTSSKVVTGEVIKMGGLTMTVRKIVDQVAYCDLQIKLAEAGELKGSAKVELKGPFISILQILGSGTIGGIAVQLEARP